MKITLTHGAGGEEMHALIRKIAARLPLKKTAGGRGLDLLEDGAVIPIGSKNIIFAADSHTISPWKFRGGDIGKLSVCGTLNDLAVMGAEPLALSLSFLIEEGFEEEAIEEIAESIGRESKRWDVPIVTGDTKVMEKGKLDNIALNTSGIGIAQKVISNGGLQEGDRIIVSGTVGDHAATILAHRYEIRTGLRSDCACVLPLMRAIKELPITAAKDPTRGGLASCLCELSEKSGKRIVLEEENIPVRKETKSICEMLGVDVLQLANEGKVVFGVEGSCAEKALKKIRKTELGKNARVIGEVQKGRGVLLKTKFGTRVIEKPAGDPAPRIC